MAGEAVRLGARGEGVKALCVFVHGRGQSPEEMEETVVSRLEAPDVAFLLPRAPRGAWYDARAVDPLTDAARGQLDEAVSLLAAAIAELRADYPGLPLLLGGFSQGACLSLEYCWRGIDRPEALAALTGCRVGAASDVRPAALPSRLPVYLSGGDADPWIPVSAFAEAALGLGSAGAILRADVFPGRGHEVCMAEIAMLDGMLADLAFRRPLRLEAPR